MTGVTADGIVSGRLGRWDQTGWQDVKGVPWDLPTGVSVSAVDVEGHPGRETKFSEEECKRKEHQQQHQHQRDLPKRIRGATFMRESQDERTHRQEFQYITLIMMSVAIESSRSC